MRLIEGTLPPDRVRELEAHCDGCRALRAHDVRAGAGRRTRSAGLAGRALPAARAAGRGEHRRGVRGARREAASKGRDQAAARWRARRRRDCRQLDDRSPARTLPARGAAAGVAVASQRADRSRRRRNRPRDLRGHGAGRRLPDVALGARDRAAPRSPADRRSLLAGRPRSLGGASAERRSPRRQAREHPGGAQRTRPHRRLRAGGAHGLDGVRARAPARPRR